jgi:hypothetical protein
MVLISLLGEGAVCSVIGRGRGCPLYSALILTFAYIALLCWKAWSFEAQMRPTYVGLYFYRHVFY